MVKLYHILIFTLLYYNVSFSQTDTIYINIDLLEYRKRAYNELKNDGYNELNDDRFVSIPIFHINRLKVNNFNCKDNPEDLILFIQNPKYQRILLDTKPYYYDIQLDTVYRETSFCVPYFGNYWKTSDKKFLKFIKEEHKSDLVFAINKLDGYWIIDKNQFKRLKINIFGNVKIVSARKTFNYGEEYLRHASLNTAIVGHIYKLCDKKNISKRKKVFIIPKSKR